MAALIAWDIVTVDGCFEGARKWDLDMHQLAWGPELEELSHHFGDTASWLVFGRVTYEGMAAYWKAAEPGRITSFMNALPKLVASRTLKEVDWNNSRVTADIVPEIERLKAVETRPLYIFGSAELTHSLLEAGLVDELILCVVPVLLGQGTSFFKPGRRVDLDLTRSRALTNGCVVNHYRVRSRA